MKSVSYLYILQFTCFVFFSTRCIPKYWKTKSLANLSDLKKEEANSLNLRIYQALSAQFQDVLSLSSCQETGLNAIELGMVFRIIKTFSYFHYFYVIFMYLRQPLRLLNLSLITITTNWYLYGVSVS